MLPILQVGPIAVQTSGLILLIGLWVGLSLSEKFSPKRGIASNSLYSLVFTALITAIIAGRITYFLRYPAAFKSSPHSLISINPALFDSESGILFGVVGACVYGYRKGFSFWRTLDAITPLLLVLGVAIGLSHLASGSAFGSAVDLPWSIELWGTRRHPAQIYETLLAVSILIVLWPGRERIASWLAGKYFLSFGALYALARLFVEAFRGDSLTLSYGIRLIQIPAWFVLIGCLILIQRIETRVKKQESGKT
jgi:phosphatidylglycerol---prolipoprotein diacylglyceryl transferase